VSSYWFEIVRRGYDRFSWVFIEDRGDQPRILASGNRDFKSRKKVKRAIARLQKAQVREATGEPNHFERADTRFELTPYALPLLVGEPSGRFGHHT
jgi:hypothetical protein